MEDSLAGAEQLPAQVHLCKMAVIRPHSSISLQIVDLTFLPCSQGREPACSPLLPLPHRQQLPRAEEEPWVVGRAGDGHSSGLLTPPVGPVLSTSREVLQG